MLSTTQNSDAPAQAQNFLDNLHQVLLHADWMARGTAPVVCKAWRDALVHGTGDAHWQWLCERLRDERLLKGAQEDEVRIGERARVVGARRAKGAEGVEPLARARGDRGVEVRRNDRRERKVGGDVLREGEHLLGLASQHDLLPAARCRAGGCTASQPAGYESKPPPAGSRARALGAVFSQISGAAMLSFVVACASLGLAAAGTSAEGKAWLEAKGAEPGVVTLASGLMYKVLREGDGDSHPHVGTSCECHYEGKLTDGTVFDSSYERGSPTSFAPNQVIKGWTEAMQLMVEGDKWEMYIPYHLAYGEHGKPPKIPAKATLIFIMELVKIKGTSKPVEDFPEWSPEDLTLWTEKDQAACDQWTEKKVQAFEARRGPN